MDTILAGLTDTKDFRLISTSQLALAKRLDSKSKNKIAVVYLEGEITDNKGDGIVGKEVLKTLKKVGKNDQVKAVVLRVNSPGGSADASEQIWHAEQLLKKQGLPVVVSMGDYAASGGYYISCSADYIYAEPTTLTGSIGIFGMIPSVKDLCNKIGVDVDGVATHDLSMLDADLLLNGMNEREHALMQAMVERGYDLFTSRCAEGRHMPQDSIKVIGEGRVWLGKDALRLGLVDELGNIDDAIAKAAALAEFEDYALTYYPAPKDFMTELMESLDNTTDEEKMLLRMRDLVKEPRIMAIHYFGTIK
jgi:protease-4